MSESIQTAAIPRQRFNPCDSLRVNLAAIEPHIPAGRLLRSSHPGETIDLPTAIILAHVVPLISLDQLSSLLPDFVEPSTEPVRLPAQALALSYPLKEKPVRPDDDPFIPSIDTRLHSPVANLRHLSRPTPVEAPLTPPTETLENPPPAAPDTEERPTPTPHSHDLPEPLPRKLAEIFPNLPTFRRVENQPVHPHPSTSITITLESSTPTTQLPEDTQDALQSLFLTEDTLDLPKVVELCGSLPGVESCVLAHEDRVLSSHNAPDGLDLVSLSSNASAMLRSMQDASEKMGIGDIPAVTLHTPKGPLSILQQERLTLIVLHGKRGFIPGVREKMTATLAELNRSQLQLPAPQKPGPLHLT